MSIPVLSQPGSCSSICTPEDVESCRARLSEYSRYWVKTGNASQLINMMNVVPHEVLQEDVTLSINCLTALAYEQHFDQADSFLERWLDSLRKRSIDDLEAFTALKNNLTGVVVLLKTLRGDLSLISENAIQNIKQSLEIPGQQQAMLNNIFAYLLYMNGKYAKAQHFAARAYLLSIASENWFARAIATLLQCVCDRAQGHFDVAYKSVAAAMRAYEVVNDSPAWAVLALVRAMFEYETNQLTNAEALLKAAKPRLAMSAISDFRVNAGVMLARVHASRDNFIEAEAVLNELLDWVNKGNDKRWTDYIAHERLRVALLAGKPNVYAQWQEKAMQTQGEADEALRTKYCPAVGHVPERTHLMLALLERDLDAAERALGQLGKICSLYSDSFLRVVVLSGSAALAWGRQNPDQAIVYLNEALLLCEQSHLYRTLFDENFVFFEVFQLARTQGRLDPDLCDEWLQRLKEERFPAPRRQTIVKMSALTPCSGGDTCVENLTDTEIKVLDLLSQGLSNKDISRRLGIAVTTTKWHLKNIFGKLATSNRVGAVVKARELQLLSLAGEIVNALPATLSLLPLL